MKEKKNINQIDLNRVIIAGAVDISMRVMALSNSGLLSYTPNQLLPNDNPELCILVGAGIVRTLACDLLIKDARYRVRREQLETQVRAIIAQGGDDQIIIEQINHAVGTECDYVCAENQELIEREFARRLPKALDFIKDKYKIRFEWMITSLVLDSVLSVSPVAVGPGLVKSLHALEGWIVQEDLKLPKKESGGSRADYDLTNLPDHYELLLPIWNSAKEQAKEAQNDPILRENWRRRTKASYSVELPDDLVEWLNENKEEKSAYLESITDLVYLPRKLKHGYMLSKPSEFALEHSARLCGVPPYYYSKTRLFEILREKQTLWFKTTF